MIELKKYFNYVLDNYLLPENAKFSSQMEYYKVIVNRIPEEISKLFDNKKYKIYGACGKGAKSASPYIAILDRSITTSVQRGIYVDFIFKSDMSGFYLTIDQGITNIKEKYGNKIAKEKAQQAADYFRSKITDLKGFEAGLVSGHAKSGSLEEGYENTRVIAKYYKANNYTNEELIKDLQDIMIIYNELLNGMLGKTYDDIIEELNGSSWNEIYKEIALKTLEYKNDHAALISIMYEILEELGLFSDDAEKNCNLDKYKGVRCRYDDIDPFSFMNRLDIFSEKNRKGFIRLFQQKTGLKVNIPDNFDGIPSVNPQNTMFIRFKDERGENDVSDFWKMFEVAIKYLSDDSQEIKNQFVTFFDKCASKPGCSYNLTMGLFRIDSNFYINLDSTNRTFIKKEFGIDINKCPSGQEYLKLLDLIKEKISNSNKYASIMEFSKQAWLNKVSAGIQYWTYSPGENATEWKYCLKNNKMVLGFDEISDLSVLKSRDKIGEEIKKAYKKDNPYNDISACDDFLNKMQIGDVIIAKIGQKQLLGYGIVTGQYYYDGSKESYRHARNVKWEKSGNWNIPDELKVAQKTLTDITPYGDFANRLLKIIEGDENMNNYTDIYDKEAFLKEVFINSDKYDSIVSVLKRKKNIILEGAPGVGKTFIAKRLAYSLIGKKDESKVKLIQFHQNYSYEDFIEGYRPTENGFKLEKGIFYNFCELAKKDPDNDYYMVIDEINRGNLSKIFGELLMLIENDKRGDKLTLAYSKEEFYVPNNLYIIGLMNTADRSLALIDYALRRRFSFIRIEPAFDSELFMENYNKIFDSQFNTLIDLIKTINKAIEDDKSLGSGFEIGHSYFLPKLENEKGDKKDLEDIVRFEIVPLLEEYWYDDEDTLIKWKDSLTGYFK